MCENLTGYRVSNLTNRPLREQKNGYTDNVHVLI